MRKIAVVGLALLAACGADVSWEGALGRVVRDRRDARPNLLVVVVDSLRRDAVGCYSARTGVTPAIDQLARTGLRCDKAFATSAWNVPAVASLMTGRRPSEHGIEALGDQLPRTLPTIASALRRGGYATAAVVGQFRVGATRGFDQGFDVFRDDVARGDDEATSDAVTEAARELLLELAAGADPFLLWVHYADPHASWIDRDEFAFAEREGTELRGGESLAELRLTLSDEHAPLSAADKAFIGGAYAEEVAAVDAGIATLVDALDGLGVGARTLVLVTSSHGQEFFERGDLGPATSLFQEQVAVPLVVRPPAAWNRPRGLPLDVPLTLGGLAATLAEVAELPHALRGDFDLPSFAPVLRGSGRSPGGIVFELDVRPVLASRAHPTRSLAGATDGRFKLVRDRTTGTVQLFDLALDPRETRNIAELHPGAVETLTALIEPAAP